jgi:hypothetical protein
MTTGTDHAAEQVAQPRWADAALAAAGLTLLVIAIVSSIRFVGLVGGLFALAVPAAVTALGLGRTASWRLRLFAVGCLVSSALVAFAGG